MPEVLAERVVIQTSLDPWLDLVGAARYVSLSRKTLLRAGRRRENPLPLRSVGGKLLIRASELDTWIEREHRRRVERPRGEIRDTVNTLAAAVLEGGNGPGQDKPLRSQSSPTPARQETEGSRPPAGADRVRKGA